LWSPSFTLNNEEDRDLLSIKKLFAMKSMTRANIGPSEQRRRLIGGFVMLALRKQMRC